MVKPATVVAGPLGCQQKVCLQKCLFDNMTNDAILFNSLVICLTYLNNLKLYHIVSVLGYKKSLVLCVYCAFRE